MAAWVWASCWRSKEDTSILKRAIAAILFVALLPQLAGCTAWRVQGVPPAQAITDTRPRDVRVRLRHNNSTVVIQQAGIVGDSLVGYRWAHHGPSDRRPRVAVALADVQEVAVAESSGGKTLLAIGVPLIAVLIAMDIAAHHMSLLGGVTLF